MKAAWYETLGSAESVLQTGELPTPTALAGEVLIRLYSSGVNPSDVKMRAGTRAGGTKMPYPKIIPHSDGAGIIESVGPGIDKSRIGERVWISNAQWQRASGSAAEYIAIDADLAALLPDNTSFEIGASLGIPAITACHSVFSHGSVEGKSILISGAAGTVGHLAIQLARMGGARVIATVRGEKNKARAIKAGAHKALDFTDDNLAEQIIAANDNCEVDRIIEVEFGSNADTNAKIIKTRGKIVTFGSARQMRPELPFYPLMFKGVTIEFVLVYLLEKEERKSLAELINHALTDGKLSVPIHSKFKLSEITKAHEQVENGKNGSVVVNMS